MASLQAKHLGSCAISKPWTTFAAANTGCTCPHGPLYYVVVRTGVTAHKTPVGRSRKQAERALRKIAVSVDEGDFRPQRNIRFAEWGDAWLSSLERKRSTIDSYGGTVVHAARAFGSRRVRDIRVDDIASLKPLDAPRRTLVINTGQALASSPRVFRGSRAS